MKNVYIKTYGCQMNEYDSSRMIDLLKDHFAQIQIVDKPDNADLLILNTCSIRNKAEEKVFSELGRWRIFIKKRPKVIIGVAGCVASQEGESIRKRAPFVNLIFGPQTFHRLPDMIKDLLEKHKPIIDIEFPEIEKFDNLPVPIAQSASAYVSIQEGCSKYCSYCIVPYTRGEEINRPFDDVILEIIQLSEQGVKEITLLGQNVNAYRGNMHNGDIADLALLITYIAEIHGIERIRFTTSHPIEFSESLIRAYADIPKLANHIHLPVQSGSDRILNRMKRGHTILEYKYKIKELRKVRPDICISSDFIVGFPGESDEDFAETISLVEEIGFDKSFSFIYSRRPGTPASEYKDNVKLDVKKQRLKILQSKLKKQNDAISESMLGTIQKILITKPSKLNSNVLSGRTENNRVVNIYAPMKLMGQLVEVTISEVKANSLFGTLL